MKNYSIFGCILGCIAMLLSCNSTKNKTEYVPFKSSSKAKWGMMSVDGKVLFEEEFKDEPTVVINGMFLVKNGNDLWEVYKASEKPEKVGDEYVDICPFTEDVTPAVKKDEKITLIDKTGAVKATLDKVKGKNIIRCSGFKNGYASIMTEDNKVGLIDTKGNVVIEPKYDDLSINDEGIIAAANINKEDKYLDLSFLSANGDVKLKLKVGEGQKYSDIDLNHTTSERIAVCTKSDDEKQWGFINYEKEVIMKPSSKVRRIVSMQGDMFTFRNEDNNYGLMNIQGEVLIRAKYDLLGFASDELLICQDDNEYEVIDLNGEKVTKDKYKSITRFLDDEHAFVRVDDNSWSIIDKKGEELKDLKVDIYDVGLYDGSSYVESDFVDYDAILADMMFTKDGVMGYSINMTPQQIIKNYNEKIAENEDALPVDLESNARRDKVEMSKSYKGVELAMKLYYSGYMGEGVWYGPTTWTTQKPAYIRVALTGDKMKGKAKTMFTKISTKIKGFGKVIKENGGAVVVKVDDNTGWVVCMENKESVTAMVVSDGSFKYANIDQYAVNGEETRVVEGAQEEDIVVADSVEPDTVAAY